MTHIHTHTEVDRPHTNTHTLTSIWSNLNLHPEKPLPWWQTELKPHPAALSISHFSSFPPSLIYSFSVTYKHHSAPLADHRSRPCPRRDWLFAAAHRTGKSGSGLGLWAGWPQVRRLAPGWVLVFRFWGLVGFSLSDHQHHLSLCVCSPPTSPGEYPKTHTQTHTHWFRPHHKHGFFWKTHKRYLISDRNLSSKVRVSKVAFKNSTC